MSQDICKGGGCNFAYPILETECAGNSLSSINYNFLSLNQEMCSIESKVTDSWGPAFTAFSENSANWMNALTLLQTNSSCWLNTRNVVSEMSAFWLTPIAVVYPYPAFSSSSSSAIQIWLNEALPIKQGACVNYIVGQELYVYSPEYGAVTRTNTQGGGQGVKTVCLEYVCNCIGAGTYVGTACTNVDCGTYSVGLTVPDAFINDFRGLKYIVNSAQQWEFVSTIF